MKFPSLEEVANADTAEIIDMMGFTQQAESIKAGAKEVLELDGEARKAAERMWQDRLRPHVSGSDFRWIKEDAIREAQDPKDVLDDENPASIV